MCWFFLSFFLLVVKWFGENGWYIFQKWSILTPKEVQTESNVSFFFIFGAKFPGKKAQKSEWAPDLRGKLYGCSFEHFLTEWVIKWFGETGWDFFLQSNLLTGRFFHPKLSNITKPKLCVLITNFPIISISYTHNYVKPWYIIESYIFTNKNIVII